MKTHILRALSEKSFFNLWVGEVFTQISINIFNFFLILIVFKLTQSNTAVSIVVLSFTIPAIFLGSVAGALVDRWNKRYVLILTNLLRAVLFILLAFFLDNLFLIYLVSFIVSMLTQFFIPAESPMIPLIVKKEHLLSANALFGMGIFGSILIAYALSGPLILLVGNIKTLIILSFMLFAGAIFIAVIKSKNRINKQQKINYKFNILKDIKHTLILISTSREISNSILFISASQIIVLILATIAPGYAYQVLGIDVEKFSITFVAPAALGMVIGSIILVNFFHSHAKEKVINTGIFISGIAMLLLPYGSRVASRDFVQVINAYLPHFFDITILHIMSLLAFVLGIANSLIFVPSNTIIQEKTTEEFRGKIYGTLNSVVGVFSFLPIIIAGGLSDLVGVGNVITFIGICIIIFGFTKYILK